MNIEELDLDIKVYNRLKKNLPDVCTVNHLITEMYDEHGVDKVSAPDMKAIEKALKDKGIFKYMRGDEVSEDDIEPTPLTWDELRQYVGGLVVTDDSTQSHRWLHLCWIYDMDDERMSYLCRGNGYLNTRRASVENDNAQRVEFAGEMLRHEGHFFALKKYALRLDSLELEDDEDDWPHGETFYFSDNPEVYGKELTYDELYALPDNTHLLVDDTACEEDGDSDLACEHWRIDGFLYSRENGIHLECLDEEDNIQNMTITRKSMEQRDSFWTRVFLKADGVNIPAPKKPSEAPEKPVELVKAEPSQIILSDDFKRAVALTRSIIANAEAAAQSMWEVCKCLAEMKDKKLYKALDFQTFEEYCEQKIGITRRQGQKYAAIALLPENGKLTSDFEKIGVEKLYLLTKIDEEQREQIVETVDVESATVKQLKAEIDKLKGDVWEEEQKRKAAENMQSVERAQRKETDAAFERAQARIASLEADKQAASESVDKIKKLNAEIANNSDYIGKLQKKIAELESRPVEVAVQEDTEALEKLKKEYDAKLKEAQEDAQYREVLALVSNASIIVNNLCIRLNGIPRGKARDSLVKKTKEIGLMLGMLN